MGVGRGKRSPHERQRYAGVHLLAHANALRANASRASRMSLRSSGLHLLKRRLHGSIIHHNPPPTVPAVISGPRIHCAVRYSETRSASAGRASRVSPHDAGDRFFSLKIRLQEAPDNVRISWASEPTGKSLICLSSPSRKNILIFRKRKSLYNPSRPVPQRGGSRSSRTRDRMRWTLMRLLTNGA